jgi:hypothetical protein
MYYVYLYRDPDGVPMYVGKGFGTRSHDHLKKSRRGKTAFHDALSLLEAEDKSATIEIVQDGLTDEQAFALERELIKSIGRRCVGTGTLYNHAKGGNGGAGPRSLDVRQKISKKMAGIPKAESTLAKMRNRTLAEGHVMKLKAVLSGAGNGQAKVWLLRNPAGEELRVSSLHTFCKDHGLAYSSLVQSEGMSNPIKNGKSAGWKVLRRLGSTRSV